MTTIKITGPGGCIDSEVVIIANVFRSLGYEVTVENITKSGVKPSKAEMDKTVSHVIAYNKSPPKFDTFECKRLAVHIVADHIPWGG